ncbi:uncharacterized protein LOC110837201 isoform X2 [Zootermopsis nevadensis]|uniref:uncharacterized protein LOC110837201 isoform X2 n=1 Tax=Zootermopsis nevadensis TaxID=136037 RepID=UPI000B8E4A81|nr:uncharacterized protein LOC110837201 isoform X2 [Zootermopsis nevadensis]
MRSQLFGTNVLLIEKGANQNSFQTGTEGWLVGIITCFSLHCVFCFLMLYGTFRVSLWCVYPFLVLEIARLVFLTTSFVIAMLLVKENIADLGLLGGFVLLYLFYQWFCVLSFIQIVKELELVHKMGHYEEGKLNFHKYQRMNVLELGAERYPMSEDFVPVADFSRHYNKKSINENIRSRFSIDSDYNNVMARPVY